MIRTRPRMEEGRRASPQEEAHALRSRLHRAASRLAALEGHIGTKGSAPGRPSRVPVVDPERCKGCGRCVEVCPSNALHLKPVGLTRPRERRPSPIPEHAPEEVT